MFINRKEKFSIRKFKDGRSDSVKIGTVALLVGAALAMSGQSQTAAAEVKDNGDNTTTISNDKGSITVDTANITMRSKEQLLQLIQLKMEQIQSLKLEK